MASTNRRLRVDRMETFLNPPRFARDLWDQASAPVNHRYDKLGNPLPMELHGCGCGLCARQRRAQLRFQKGSPRSHGEGSDFVGNIWGA